MTKRKVLAAATLAALPMFVGAAQSAPTSTTAETTAPHTVQSSPRPAGPQWGYALGLEGEEALMFGVVGAIECSFFGPAGGIACGIAGAL